jgi:glycosyltransferase involved in cell wall biosynthesis
LVYPSFFEGFGVPVLEAMYCDVSVITSQNSPIQQIAGDDALFADTSDYEDIADKMMRIYKDEYLRNELIKKGQLITPRFSWYRTADLFWKSILIAVE